jgi:uncharacterized membrane protein YhaH (DUF805 family)
VLSAVATCFRKYVDFRGRARRSEFWWFFLFSNLFRVAAGMAGDLVRLFAHAQTPAVAAVVAAMNVAAGLASLACFLPGLAVSVRRLHDTGRTGWCLLVLLIPVLGVLLLLIFFCSPATPEGARYDTDVSGSDTADVFN